MDLIQNVHTSAPEDQSDEVAIKQKRESTLSMARDSENSNGSFDCNICFDLAHDPVVTLCGHLYCWACIFKWLHVSSSSDPDQQPTCPVCKANISQSSLVPLYCHGPSNIASEPGKPFTEPIPPRPTVCGINYPNQQVPPNPTQSSLYDDHHYLTDPSSNNTTIQSSSLVSTTVAGIINPTIGLLGELVYARMSGNSDNSFFSYPLPSSYAIMGRGNTRMRRQEMQLDKSLSRVSLFLFCCLILCLLLF